MSPVLVKSSNLETVRSMSSHSHRMKITPPTKPRIHQQLHTNNTHFRLPTLTTTHFRLLTLATTHFRLPILTTTHTFKHPHYRQHNFQHTQRRPQKGNRSNNPLTSAANQILTRCTASITSRMVSANHKPRKCL